MIEGVASGCIDRIGHCCCAASDGCGHSERGTNPWAPTKMGRELMRLLPAHVEALYADCNTVDARRAPGYDSAKIASVGNAVTRSHGKLLKQARAILRRPITELSHLTDTVIVMVVFEDEWEDEYGMAKHQATQVLSNAILGMSGVSYDDCSIGALYGKIAQKRDKATANACRCSH